MIASRIASATICVVLLACPPSARAVVLATLKTGTPELRLCPSTACPAVPAQLPGSRGMVPIYEFSGGFVRVGPWTTREEAQARFAGIDASRLPERVALWVSRSQVATGDPAADDAAALAALKEAKAIVKPVRPPLPAFPPVPERAPRGVVAGTHAANTVPAGAGFLLPLPPGALRIASNAPALQPSEQTIIPEPKQKIDESDNLESVAPPGKLTPELMDKRLAVLPAKPDADYSLQQIVALRRQALTYLEQGSCEGIREGGKTLSPGFLYIVCDGDEAWRQFAE